MLHPSRPVEDLVDNGLPIFAPFFAELRRRGYAEGDNLIVDRWTGLGAVNLDDVARRIVASGPDVIYGFSTSVTGPPLQRATHSIPIVVSGNDPVAAGLITDPAHPGVQSHGDQ